MGEEKHVAASASRRQKPDDSETPVVWHARRDAASRHNAISRHVFTYANYKAWVEKMRIAWDEEDDARNSKAARRR